MRTLKEQLIQQSIGRPSLKVCKECGETYFLFHPKEECKVTEEYKKAQKDKHPNRPKKDKK